MSDLNTVLQGAWRYVDKNRGKWNAADESAWRQALLLLKREVNSFPFGTKCDEETIAPLKQIILEMPKSWQQSTEDTPIFRDITRMASECRQYIGLTLFYVFSWAATAAPFKGTSMLDTMSSLENLLLACWVKESAFNRFRRYRFRRLIYGSKRAQATPATLTADDLWKMFVQWRTNINVIVVPTAKDIRPDIETTILEESIDFKLNNESTSSPFTPTPSVFSDVHPGTRLRTSSIASSLGSLDGGHPATPDLRKAILEDSYFQLDFRAKTANGASTSGSDTPTSPSSIFTAAPTLLSRTSSSNSSRSGSLNQILCTPDFRTPVGSILPRQRYSWEEDSSQKAGGHLVGRALDGMGSQFSSIGPDPDHVSGKDISRMLEEFSALTTNDA